MRIEEIDCLILERQSREHVECRARAGFLAANSVRILEENGLAAGLLTYGHQHDTCAFRSDHAQFELKYSGEDLVSDLIAEYVDRGGDVRFEMTVVDVNNVGSDRPWITWRSTDGEVHQWSGRYVAGCDGQHGISRQAVTASANQRDHEISWLAILVEAPQSMAAVTYAIHGEGFAGHMARNPSVTRYYLQCPQGDDPEHWPDRRIWDELHLRMRADQYGPLRQGPILERRVVDMRSNVMDPIQYGRLFLAGDAARLISPSAAKGANLAIMEAEALAKALITALRRDGERPLARYSAECMPRIWRAQEFSHWMISLLHNSAGSSDEAVFLRALQRTPDWSPSGEPAELPLASEFLCRELRRNLIFTLRF